MYYVKISLLLAKNALLVVICVKTNTILVYIYDKVIIWGRWYMGEVLFGGVIWDRETTHMEQVVIYYDNVVWDIVV